jgi:hypothetical protein
MLLVDTFLSRNTSWIQVQTKKLGQIKQINFYSFLQKMKNHEM